MSEKQPEALRLADALEQQFPVGTAQDYLDGESAKELRRLHEVNQELLEALRWYEAQAKNMGKAAIHSDSKTILSIMHEVAVDYGKRARAAIAKAEGREA